MAKKRENCVEVHFDSQVRREISIAGLCVPVLPEFYKDILDRVYVMTTA